MDKVRWDELKKEKPKKEGPRFMDKEIDIDIKINPKKAFKGVAIVVLFLCIFFLGRWSAGCPGCVADALPAEVPEESSSGWSSFLSSITGLFVADTEEVVAETEPVPDAEAPVEEAPAEEEAPIEEVELEAPVEEEVEEVVITSPYHKVSFVIKAVDIDWRETWGKITRLQYTIKNSEEGTIKPDHFTMTVDGYQDEASKKNVPVSLDSHDVKSKTSVSSAAIIPGGFNYHSQTVGDLSNVKITFILFDFEGKPMASYRAPTGFDLSG